MTHSLKRHTGVLRIILAGLCVTASFAFFTRLGLHKSYQSVFPVSQTTQSQSPYSAQPISAPRDTPFTLGDDCIGCTGSTWSNEISTGIGTPDGVTGLSTETVVRPVIYLTQDYPSPSEPPGMRFAFDNAIYLADNFYKLHISGFYMDIRPIEVYRDPEFSFSSCLQSKTALACGEDLMHRADLWIETETVKPQGYMPLVFLPEAPNNRGHYYPVGTEGGIVLAGGLYQSEHLAISVAHELGHVMNLRHSYYHSVMGYSTPDIEVHGIFNTGLFPEKRVICESSLNLNHSNCTQYTPRDVNNMRIIPSLHMQFLQPGKVLIPHSCFPIMGAWLRESGYIEFNYEITGNNGDTYLNDQEFIMDGELYDLWTMHGEIENVIMIKISNDVYYMCHEYGINCRLLFSNGAVPVAQVDEFIVNMDYCSYDVTPTPNPSSPTPTPSGNINCTQHYGSTSSCTNQNQCAGYGSYWRFADPANRYCAAWEEGDGCCYCTDGNGNIINNICDWRCAPGSPSVRHRPLLPLCLILNRSRSMCPTQ